MSNPLFNTLKEAEDAKTLITSYPDLVKRIKKLEDEVADLKQSMRLASLGFTP